VNDITILEKMAIQYLSDGFHEKFKPGRAVSQKGELCMQLEPDPNSVFLKPCANAAAMGFNEFLDDVPGPSPPP